MSKLHDTFDHFFPPAEELWEKGGAEYQTIAVNGQEHELPLFGLEVTDYTQVGKTKEFRSKKQGHRKIGSEVLCKLDVNGVSHLGRVLIPDDTFRRDEETDFAFNRSTAYTTSIHGYAERGSKAIAARTGRSFVQTGAAYSGETGLSPLEFLKVPKVVREARKQSLYAQSEARVVMHKFLVRKFGLPEKYAILDDSMAAMNQSPMFSYDFIANNDNLDDELTAECSNIVGFYAKGRSVIEKIELGDVPKVGLWGAKMVLGVLAASACLAREGKLHTVCGSISLNPQFQASAWTGSLRAVAGGEAGHALSLIPRLAGGLEVLYGNDDLSDAGAISEHFEPYPNVRTKIVPEGTHGAIIHSLADKSRTEWAVRLSDAYDGHSGHLGELDWRRINKVPEIDPVAETIETIKKIAS